MKIPFFKERELLINDMNDRKYIAGKVSDNNIYQLTRSTGRVFSEYMLSKSIKLSILLSLISCQLVAIGTNFLTVPTTSRELALAGFSSSVSGDVSLYHGNPALIVSGRFLGKPVNSPKLQFGYNVWFVESQGGSFLFTNPLAGGMFGFGLRYLGLSDLEYRTDTPTDDYLSLFSASGSALEAIWGRRINKLNMGVTLRWIRIETDVDNSSGVGADFGVWIPLMKNRLTFGASIQNVGKMNKFIDTSPNLPLTFSTGLTYHTSGQHFRANQNLKSSMTIGVEISKLHGSVLRLAEEMFWSGLRLTLGTRLSQQVSSVSGGVGLKWRRFEFGYGIEINSNQLGIPHLFDFGIILP